MSTYTKNDFVVYQDGFQTGMVEALEQEVSVLNAGPRGIIVVTANTRGEYLESAFFKNVDNLVTDRDPTSTAPVNATTLTQDQIKDILCNYKVGPHKDSLDSFRKINENPTLMSVILGEMAGSQLAEKYLNGGLGALVAAMSTEAGMVFDATDAANAAKVDGQTISFQNLNRAMGLMGDKRSRLRMHVLPSAVHTALIGHQIAEKLGEVSGSIVYGGAPGTFGLPAYVTDSPALSFEKDFSVGQDGSDLRLCHRHLVLTEGALVLQQNDYFDLSSGIDRGGENLLASYQAEGSYLVRVKGFSWDGANAPTDAQLAVPSNWEYAFESVKAGPGVMLIVADVEPE